MTFVGSFFIDLSGLHGEAPAAHAEGLRKFQLEEHYETGRAISQTVQAGLSQVPWGEIASAARVAAGKLPEHSRSGGTQPGLAGTGESRGAVEFALPKSGDYVPDIASRTTGSTAGVRNAIIDDIAAKELSGVRFTHTPEDNPFLRPLGVAQEGAGSQIGPQGVRGPESANRGGGRHGP